MSLSAEEMEPSGGNAVLGGRRGGEEGRGGGRVRWEVPQHSEVSHPRGTWGEGGKFLKKLWCCVSGRVQQGNLVLSTELIMYLDHQKELQS